jgi:hypothetical protein
MSGLPVGAIGTSRPAGSLQPALLVAPTAAGNRPRCVCGGTVHWERSGRRRPRERLCCSGCGRATGWHSLAPNAAHRPDVLRAWRSLAG